MADPHSPEAGIRPGMIADWCRRPFVLEEQARAEADLLREIARTDSCVDEDNLRVKARINFAIALQDDPAYHPTLNRTNTDYTLFAAGNYVDKVNSSVAIEILWRAAKYATSPGWPTDKIFSPAAIELWLRRGQGWGHTADPRATKALTIDVAVASRRPTPEDWMFVEDCYAAIMLLAVGAPARLIAFEGGPTRDLVVSRAYADAFLGPWDVRRRCVGIPPGQLAPWAIAAALRAAHHILCEDADRLRQLDGMTLAIVECARARPEWSEDGRLVDVGLAADLSAFCIMCDWIEEHVDGSIASNLRQLGTWLEAIDP